MSNNVSMPDPAAQVAEIRQVIQDQGEHSCESTLLAIRRVVFPPPAEPLPGGWPELSPSDAGWLDTGSGPGVGTAWERHDDPETDR